MECTFAWIAGELKGPALPMAGTSDIGTLLLERRFQAFFAAGLLAKRQNHHREVMHWTLAPSRQNPSDEDEAQECETGKEIITLFLNQLIQKPRDTHQVLHRMFHTSY